MTVHEAIVANADLLKTLAGAGVTIDDVHNIDLYSDFNAMQLAGDKTTYIVACLRDKYAISERTVWRVIRKFRRDLSSD